MEIFVCNYNMPFSLNFRNTFVPERLRYVPMSLFCEHQNL